MSARNPLARISRRVVAVVAACNYAGVRLASLRNTPSTYATREN